MKKNYALVSSRRPARTTAPSDLSRVGQKHLLTCEPKTAAPSASAFTLTELLVVIALLAFSVAMVMPALARTRPNAHVFQCLNNLRQLTCGWKMYATDNNDRLTSAFTAINPNKNPDGTILNNTTWPIWASWVYGNADDSGFEGSYGYRGTDKMGLEQGMIYPYIKGTGVYKCPADKRVALGGTDAGKPIVRSVSMNSCLAGRTYGDPNSSWNWQSSPNPPGNLKYKMYMKVTQIFRPAQTFVLMDEDPQSINDGMFMVDEEAGPGLVDLPSRQHSMGYGITFADGHSDMFSFKNKARYQTWNQSGLGHDEDTRQIHDNATFPLAPWPYKL